MRFRFRKRIRLWPFYVVITQRGFSSWGIKIWRWTHNFTRGTHSLDTPGPGALYSQRRRPARWAEGGAPDGGRRPWR